MADPFTAGIRRSAILQGASATAAALAARAALPSGA